MVEIDADKPHPVRMYDWHVGGRGNYPVGEAMGRRMLALDPRRTPLRKPPGGGSVPGQGDGVTPGYGAVGRKP